MSSSECAIPSLKPYKSYTRSDPVGQKINIQVHSLLPIKGRGARHRIAFRI